MKCKNCAFWGADYYGDIPYCHADPDWSNFCDYEEEEENVEE